jgi:polyisoprenoid-binding protein YceI
MIANVVGLFNQITGVIEFNPPDVGHLSVEAEVDVRSLTTGHAARDEHLLSPAISMRKYPKIILKVRTSNPWVNSQAKRCHITGISRPLPWSLVLCPVKSPLAENSVSA